MPTYKDLKELAAAFASGKLPRDEYHIELDKCGTMIALRPDYHDSMSEAEYEARCDGCKDLFATVYDGDDPSPIELALDALGIRHEWC